MDGDGTIRGIVPIIGSSEADAIMIARRHFKSAGNQGNFELWKGKIRVVAQGRAAEPEEPVLVEHIDSVAPTPY
jgi:hypothetical protein